jgi:hypothetical protein
VNAQPVFKISRAFGAKRAEPPPRRPPTFEDANR